MSIKWCPGLASGGPHPSVGQASQLIATMQYFTGDLKFSLSLSYCGTYGKESKYQSKILKILSLKKGRDINLVLVFKV